MAVAAAAACNRLVILLEYTLPWTRDTLSESSLSSLDDCLLWSLVTAESLTSDRGELALGLSLGDSRGDTAFTGMKLHTCVLWRCFLGRLPVENTVFSSLTKISLSITLSHILELY